jgi:hypothetical protein
MIEDRSEAEEYWEKSGKGYVNVYRDSKISWQDYRAARIAQKDAQGSTERTTNKGRGGISEEGTEQDIEPRFMGRGNKDRASEELIGRFHLKPELIYEIARIIHLNTANPYGRSKKVPAIRVNSTGLLTRYTG